MKRFREAVFWIIGIALTIYLALNVIPFADYLYSLNF